MGRPKKPPVEKGEKETVRADNVEYDRRVRQVIDWILSDHMNSDIVNSGMSKWGLSERQMQRYIKSANDLLCEVNNDKLEQNIAWHVQRSKKALRQLEERHKITPAGVFAIKGILEHVAKIQGLYVQKIEVESKDKKVGFPDLKEQEAKLLAKKEQDG